jgi:hypothetical protein
VIPLLVIYWTLDFIWYKCYQHWIEVNKNGLVKLTKAISHFVSNVIKYYCNPTFPKYQNEYMCIICNYWLATSENNTSNLSHTLKMFIEKLYLMRDIHLFILNQYLSLQRDGWSNTSMLPFLGINVSFIVNTDTKGNNEYNENSNFLSVKNNFEKYYADYLERHLQTIVISFCRIFRSKYSL